MGGRGASSGIKRPQYFGETEKAVKLKLVVDDYDLETKKERMGHILKNLEEHEEACDCPSCRARRKNLEMLKK